MMDLLSRLMEDEGFRPFAYLCPAGKLTIGYGRNIDPDGGRGISQSEALALLSHDVSECESDCATYYGPEVWNRIGQVRRDALTNMRFQLGPSRWREFIRMHDAIRRGDYEMAANEALNSIWAGQTKNRASRIAQELRSGVSLW
jgi:lysozyme